MAKKTADKIKRFDEHELTKPEQLSLFSLFSSNKNDYSHTINLYDEIPRSFIGKPDLVSGQFLLALQREFEVGGKNYSVKITPARVINQKGEERDFYIGKREDVIEDALRKMAAEGNRAQAVYLDGQLAVLFSRKALFDELAANGHKFSYEQIEEALEILLKSSIELSEEGSDEKHFFHPIESYGIKGRDGEDATYVKFSPFVTKSIKNNSFRLINYKKLLGYRTAIAYRLHKKLTHHFTYAAAGEIYHFSLNKTYKNFGMNIKTALSARFVEMKKGLEELKNSNIIESYQARKVHNSVRKNKIDDYVIEIVPHPEFIEDVIKANRDLKRREADSKLMEVMPDFYREKFLGKNIPG